MGRGTDTGREGAAREGDGQMTPTEQQEPPMRAPKEAPMGRTLAELNVQPGDVVHNGRGYTYTLAKDRSDYWCDAADFGILEAGAPTWHIVSRANDTRADLIAQRDALQAQIDALPPEPVVETVRMYFDRMENGRPRISDGTGPRDTYYLNVTIIDGVPQGWTKIEGASDG